MNKLLPISIKVKKEYRLFRRVKDINKLKTVL